MTSGKRIETVKHLCKNLNKSYIRSVYHDLIHEYIVKLDHADDSTESIDIRDDEEYDRLIKFLELIQGKDNSYGINDIIDVVSSWVEDVIEKEEAIDYLKNIKNKSK